MQRKDGRCKSPVGSNEGRSGAVGMKQALVAASVGNARRVGLVIVLQVRLCPSDGTKSGGTAFSRPDARERFLFVYQERRKDTV